MRSIVNSRVWISPQVPEQAPEQVGNQFRTSNENILRLVESIDGSSRVWVERKKTINLPRELVTLEKED